MLSLPERTHLVRDALQAAADTTVSLLGWVSAKSTVGGVIFIGLRDGTGYVQLATKRGRTPEPAWERARQASLESAIHVVGRTRPDSRAPGGTEVTVEDIRVVAEAAPWPITKSAMKSPGFLYDYRHLSLRGRRSRAVLRIRAELAHAAFDYFVTHGFTLISAPTLVQNAVEGGATLFKLDYFGQPAYLSQSAQLYEEAAICSLEKVFIFQPAFRAEKSRTPKHLTEFWMIEAEQAFADQEANIRLQEELVSHMCRRVVERCHAELTMLGRRFALPEPPFDRVRYDEVREQAEATGKGFPWGEDLSTEVERMVSLRHATPVFVTDYPLSARSFYHMCRADRPDVTLSADLLAPEGHGEIATGGQRLHDYHVLAERVKREMLPPESFDWYLDLRKYGLPPHSGFGLGLERITKWVCGLKHIRAACLFPRTVMRIRP